MPLLTIKFCAREEVLVDIDIDFDDALPREGVLKTLLAHAEVASALGRVYDDHAHDPYYRDQGDRVDRRLLERVLDAFLRSGERWDAEELLSARFEHADADPVAAMVADRRCEGAIDAISDGLKLDRDDVEAAFEQWFMERWSREEWDDALGYLRSWDEVEIAILPAMPQGQSIEDERIEPRRHGELHPTTVMPNAAFARLLRAINMGSAEYRREVRARYGVDLTRVSSHAAKGDAPSTWDRELAASWRALVVRCRPSQPRLLDADELFEVLENAGYGGQLAISAYASVPCLIDADWSSPVRLTGTVQIGIVDHLWGSGHSVTHEGAITLDDRRMVRVAGQLGHRFDDVCGFTRQYFRVARVEGAPNARRGVVAREAAQRRGGGVAAASRTPAPGC